MFSGLLFLMPLGFIIHGGKSGEAATLIIYTIVKTPGFGAAPRYQRFQKNQQPRTESEAASQAALIKA